MSYGKPQFRPGQPGPQQFPHQHRPSSGGGNAVLKTCLIVFGIISALGLVIILACGLGAYFIAEKGNELAERVEAEAGGEFRGLPGNTSSSTPVTPPKSFDEAIAYCSRTNARENLEGAKYLAEQPVNLGIQSEVEKALLAAAGASHPDAKSHALRGLKKWGTPSSASAVADSLSPHDRLNHLRFDLLKKWKQPVGLEKIASCLERDVDAGGAAETLKAIGPECAPYVGKYVASKGTARKHAENLFKGWGIDPNEALVDYYVLQLRSDSPHDNSFAAESLAVTDVIEDKRAAVLEATRHYSNSRWGNHDAVLKVLEKWADASAIDLVHKYIVEEPFAEERAMKLAASLQDPSSLPILVQQIPNFFRNADVVVETVSAYGQDAVEPTKAHLFSEEERARDRARRILNDLNVPDEELVELAIETLEGGGDRAANATEWLAGRDVLESHRSQVVLALRQSMNSVGIFDKRKVANMIAKWASAEEISILVELMEESDRDTWLPAFKAGLQFDCAEEMKLVTAEILDDFHRQREARDAMHRGGDGVEPLAILMLQHNEPKVCVEMVTLLSKIGGADAIGPLELLAERAKKAKLRDLESGAKQVAREIKARTKVDEGSGDDGGSDDDDG